MWTQLSIILFIILFIIFTVIPDVRVSSTRPPDDHESIACKPCSIAELASSTAATDVGMHGRLASQSCYHSVLPPSVHCGP